MTYTVNQLGTVSDLPNFGEGGVEYFGQTFIAEGPRLNNISFMIDSTGGPDATEYRVLIVDTELSFDGFDPGQVIYESAVKVQPVDGDSAYQVVTIDVGSLKVTEGQTYAFLLDAFSTKDGSAGVSKLSASWAQPTGSNYAGGHFVSLNADSGTRATHFASGTDWLDWGGDEASGRDLSFAITFSTPPQITSQGGLAEATVSVVENRKTVTDVNATDPDSAAPTYAITGGADAADFVINASTGVLSFVKTPDFEAPHDAGANNVYDVIVRASDVDGNSDTQVLHVAVANENDTGVTVNGTNGKDVVSAAETVSGQPLPTAFEDTVFGNGGNDRLSGLEGDDRIDGGKGNDKIHGGDGDDWLTGGKGKDKLYGEAGDDAFVFDASFKKAPDKVFDFSVADDTIVLSQSKFKALDLGVLDDASFRLGAKADDDDDFILYAGGKLRYDKDGAGGAKAVIFATVDKGLAMTHLDFEVVA